MGVSTREGAQGCVSLVSVNTSKGAQDASCQKRQHGSVSKNYNVKPGQHGSVLDNYIDLPGQHGSVSEN